MVKIRLPLWYLDHCIVSSDLQILITPMVSWLLYCLLWFTDSDYPYGILTIALSPLIYGFWLPLWYLDHCIVFSDLQILITPMVSWPLYCLLWLTDSDYPYCILPIVLSSLTYRFWLPLWYLDHCIVSSDLRILITPMVSWPLYCREDNTMVKIP
jgi:hypothetical protein